MSTSGHTSGIMATVDDTLDVTATAAAAASAAADRLDSVEQNQLAMTQQLNTITQQLQLLLQGAVARVAAVDVRLPVALAAVAEVLLAAAVEARLALAAVAEARVALAAVAEARVAAARVLAEERHNDVALIRHHWTSYMATHRSLNCARGGIVGTISAN